MRVEKKFNALRIVQAGPGQARQKSHAQVGALALAQGPPTCLILHTGESAQVPGFDSFTEYVT